MLWFEALPPRAGTAPDRLLDTLAPLRGLGCRRLLIPEVLDGQYATMDPLAFAAQAQEALGVPACLAITVPRLAPSNLAWRIAAAQAAGIRHFLVVGPPSAAEAVPGRGVDDALRRHGSAVRGAGGSMAVVTIPGRDRPGLAEAQRLEAKRKAGADVAVSQILLEPCAAVRLRAAVPSSLPIVWSVAPVARRRDLAFLERLGVHVAPKTRRALLAGDREARLRTSYDLAATIKETFAGSQDGVCVSHVMEGSVAAAVELLGRLREVQVAV